MLTLEQYNRIHNIIKVSEKNKLSVPINSLATPGGTIDIIQLKKYINDMVSIGFCQPKFYKPDVWNKAKYLMSIAIKLNLAKPHDHGRGKGKYTTDLKYSDIQIALFNRYNINRT